jgi:ethanolamine utilization protein EutL
VRRLPAADPALLAAYGADPTRHTSLGLVTCDQDDATYVALDEATKHAAVDVVFAKELLRRRGPRLRADCRARSSGCSPAPSPTIDRRPGSKRSTACLTHDACFYDADGRSGVTVFPHVIGSLGHYLAREAGLPVGEAMAYLVAPPLEATLGFDAALKAADVRAVKLVTPPTETNFACAWLTGVRPGDLAACAAAAAAFAEAVVEVAARPHGR